MNIFETLPALFSGDRVSHTDTFILAAVGIGAYVGIKFILKKLKKK